MSITHVHLPNDKYRLHIVSLRIVDQIFNGIAHRCQRLTCPLLQMLGDHATGRIFDDRDDHALGMQQLADDVLHRLVSGDPCLIAETGWTFTVAFSIMQLTSLSRGSVRCEGAAMEKTALNSSKLAKPAGIFS